VSFDVIGRGYDQPDGFPWLFASLGSAVLTSALHNVRHHQLADEGYVVRTLETRGAMDTAPMTTTTTTEYGTETRRS
jgi:hypothetical protein